MARRRAEGCSLGCNYPSSLAPQHLVHPLARVLHLKRGHMRVPLRCRDPGMAQDLLNDSDMNALLDQQRRRRVPGIVDPSVADLRLSEEGLPGPPVLGALDRAAMTGGEHQVMIRPCAPRPKPLSGLLLTNEVLMGWYAANDGSIRSKGTMYFVLHPHGLNMSGRWVGLGYDGRIMTGWGTMGQTQEEAEETMRRLIGSEGVPYIDG